MIQTYSSTIRRKEMDAVLTCMVDEKIGPGEMTQRLIQSVKDFFTVDSVIALRSPAIALKYCLKALNLTSESGVILSALAPLWQLQTVEELGYKPIIIDVSVDTALVTSSALEDGIKQGGRVIILCETLGNIPDMINILNLGIPIIEDISQSVGAYQEVISQNDGEIHHKKAGTYGTFSIMGLEERDLVTAGGGAVLMAPNRREGTVLKHLSEIIPTTDILPDLNSALAFVQMKEFSRNEGIRQEFFTIFKKALLSTRHKTFMKIVEGGVAVYCFPVVLDSGFKEVKQYALKKGIEIQPAFTGTIIEFLGDSLESCIHARSLFLRTAIFPLYPRLGNTQATTIIKVLGTLP